MEFGGYTDFGADMVKNGRVNLGNHHVPQIRMAKYANADDILQQEQLNQARSDAAVDILLVNPPTPDGGLWIRSQHRGARQC